MGSGEEKTKIGHGGTLDPLASGVLPIALGEATKLCGRMLESTKSYEFTILFGEETSTLDMEGEAVAASSVRPSSDQIDAVLLQFTGAIIQRPPAFSAIKVGGKPAYQRVRAGEQVEIAERQVHIFVIERLETRSHPQAGGKKITDRGIAADPIEQSSQEKMNQLTLRATVSKGTYIRSLARDIARALGTVGHLSYLRRTRAGPFSLSQAISLDFLEEAAKARALTRTVLPLDAALDDIPALPVTPAQAQLLRFGQKLVGFPAKPGLQLAKSEGTPVALVEASADGLTVVRGFNL